MSSAYTLVTYSDYDIETGQLLGSTAHFNWIINEGFPEDLDFSITSSDDAILTAYFDTKTVLAKFDPDHQQLYEITLDNTAINRSSAALDHQYCLYIAGSYGVDAYLEKHAPDGTLMSTNALTPGKHGETNRVRSIHIAADDSVYALVAHHQAAQPDKGKYSLIKVTSDGSIAWAKTIGNAYLFSLNSKRGPVSIVKYSPDGWQLWKAHSLRPDWILWIFKLTGIALFVWQILKAKRPNRTADKVEA